MGRLRRSLLLLVLVVLASGGLPWPFVGGQITNSAQQSLQEFPAWANKGPDCSGVENWATSMAFVHLKNAGINDNANVDFTNTKTTRMTSERLEEDLWRQVHHVTFTERSGNTIEVITVNNASREECSMSNVEMYVIARHLGG